MASTVSSVYIHVIDDVMSKVRDEFLNSGAGDAVLMELQGIWEAKLIEQGILPGNITRQPKPTGPNPVHDLNMPYEGPMEEYETPTAEILFPPTPLMTPVPTPLPGTAETHQSYNIPTPSDFVPINDATDVKSGRPSPYMQPPSPWMTQRPLGVDVNVAYTEGREELDRGASHQSLTQDFLMASSGKRKRDAFTSHFPQDGYIPQQDGAEDVSFEFLILQENKFDNSPARHGTTTQMQLSSFSQMDGSTDDYNSFHLAETVTEEYATPVDHVEYRAATPIVGTPKPTKNEGLDDEDDEPPLNEDDDDEDEFDDFDGGGEEQQPQHLILAQFDKVSRTKSRWKCSLKDGIMHAYGKDILFNKANGEFEF